MDEESGRGPGAKGAWPQLLLAALSMGVLMGSIGASRLQEHFGTPLFAPCVCLVKPDFRVWDCGGNLGPNPSYATKPKSLRYCMGLL